MSKGLWKRALAMVLALTLWIELVPVNVWASVSEAIEEAVEETAAEETAAVESDTEEAAVKGATEEATDETVEEVAEEAVDESVEEIAEAEVDESSEEGADSGIAVISETTDFTYSVVDSATITITGYSGTDTNVVIPATFEDLPVTSIGASAFAGNTTMTSVTVPDGVLVIGKNAFSGCSALTTAILPDSVTTMGYQAFCNCTSLTSVNYPINWTKTLNYYNNEYNSIDCGQPFYGCTALTDITVPEGVTVIAANAFTYSSVKNVSLPSTLTTISRYAFYRATNLTNINIPEGVTAIGDQAFCYCTSLAEIEIPESLTSLPTYCFANCTSLEKVTLPDTLTTLYKGVFKKCIALTEIELPDAITDLGYRVFESCTNLTTVNYPLNWTKTLNINNSEYNNIACGQPFWGCTALTEITVPEGVTVIAPNAFTYASIESVSLPSTLTTISRYAFYYATKLTDITIPEGVTEIGDEAFGYCTSLTEIEIPKSLTYLSTYCFANCTSLENVTLPDTLTTLYKGVFKKCIALTEIELPDAITDLGYRVFESCTSLETVNYPLNWTKTLNINNIEYNNSECGAPFYGCTALTSMDIPEGVTTIPANAFAYSSIEELTWPGTLTTISRYAFFSAIQLEIMTIPSTVTAIGEKAFANCSGLEMIILPEKVTLGTNALLNCPNLTVHCPLYSWASVAAINYGYPMVNTKNTKAALGNVTVDSSVSSYEMDLSYLNISGYINNTIEYTLTSAKASKYVIVYLADSVLLKESTLYVDGELCTNYTLDGNLLTIPVSNTSGKIQFYTEPQMAGEVRGYVLFQYYDGGNKQEVLDVFKETISDLTISVKDITSSADIKVSGIAPKSTTVELYVDGQLVKSTASSKAGKYSTTVTIPNPVEGRKNIVKAVCTSGDNTYEAQTTVLYQESCPEVTEFNLYYNNHQNTVLNLLETEKNQHVYFYPGVPFTFTIDFSNQENVETVYVTSTRNNETRYMKAEYDASRDLYVASGYFDENNRSYVPGTLAVKFNCAPEETFISEDFDVSSYADTGVLSEKTTVSTTQESDGSTTYHVDMTEAMTSIGKDVGDTILDFNVSMLDEVSGSYIGDLLSDAGQVKDMFSYFVPGLDDSRYIVSADFKDARTYILWVKDAGDLTDSVVQYKISLQPNDAWTSLDDFAQELSGFNTTASVVYDVAGFYKDYEDLCTEIRQSNHIQDKAGALKRANQLYGDQVAYTVMVAALGAMSAATGGTAGIMFSALLGMIGATSSFFWEARTNQILGAEATLRWAIDPSGYVYEGVTSNRVSDAKVTAYYKEELEDTEAIVWDASEFDQVNPLYTDSEGRYAWDVPEGYWQVKCEKDGYETTYSEWLAVPPPQTEVHLRMVPTAAPEVEGIEVTRESVEVVFSQYMNPATVSNIVLKDESGNAVAYQLEYDTSETDLEGNVYAKQYTFVYDESLLDYGKTITVVVPNTVVSADQKAMTATEIQGTCKAPMEIVLDESMELDNLAEHKIPFQIKNYEAGKEVLVTSEYDGILVVTDVIIDESGAGYIVVSRGFVGEADLTISVEGTSPVKTIHVTVTEKEHVHTYTTVTVEATCETDGLTKDVCTCGDTVNEKVLEKTGHTLVTDKAVEATCENAGLTEGSHCSTCNAVITEQKTIAAFGHSYETVLTKATTSADGLSKEVCATCGDVKNEETIYKISSVSLSTTAYTYNGKKKSPIVTVKDSEGNKLTKYEDYTVTFGSTKRTAIGRYSVKVTFKGNYSGTKTVYFTIGPKNPTTVKAVLYGHDDIKVTWTKVSGASGYKVYYKKSTSSTWSSKSVSSSVTSVKLKNRTDGVKYNIKVVAYKTKSGNECYNAGKSTSIYTLKKVSGVKVAKSSTKVKVSWTNISGETGYQISQSTKKTGTNIVYTYASSSGKSKTISATKGKTYYYKVRAYKKVTIDGKTKIIYGPWSTTVKYVRK